MTMRCRLARLEGAIAKNAPYTYTSWQPTIEDEKAFAAIAEWDGSDPPPAEALAHAGLSAAAWRWFLADIAAAGGQTPGEECA